MATQDKDLTSEEVLRLLTLAVWKANDANDGDCPRRGYRHFGSSTTLSQRPLGERTPAASSFVAG